MATMLEVRVHAALTEAAINHEEFACNPELADTTVFCEEYGFEPHQAANTILVAGKADPKIFAACVVLATTKLDVNKKVCKELGVKRASFANAEQTTELSGMMIGGVTIFGLPTEMPILVDSRVLESSQVVMGGGNRSSKVLLNPKELEKLSNLRIVEGLALSKE